MEVSKSERGFGQLVHPEYVPPHEPKRLASQSSVIGDYEDSLDRPGTSCLWIGADHHLNREEVQQFIKHLEQWLMTGSLQLPEE